MTSILNRAISKPCQFSSGGIRSVYLGRRSDITDYLYLSDDFSVVSQIIPSTADFYQVGSSDTATEASETLQFGKLGRNYVLSLSVYFPPMTEDVRNWIEECATDTMVAVVRDLQGKYWILGQEYGLKMTVYEAKTGRIGGNSFQQLKLTGLEPYQSRTILASDFESMIVTA